MSKMTGWINWIALIAALLGLVAAAGCGLLEAREPGDSPEVTPEPPSDDVEIVLYFADWQAQHVMPESRRVVQVGDELLAGVAVRELLSGPADPHLNPTLPADARMLSVEIVDGIVYVNLSEEVRGVYGSAGEIMAVQSLIYTLTDLEGIDRVQILIEGTKSETLGGHLMLEEPLERGEILTHPIFVDEERSAHLQDVVDAGEDAFRTDPLEVAAFDGRMAGFTIDDVFELETLDREAGAAVVTVVRGENTYAIHLVQPVRTGEGGVWVIDAVQRR